jgi:hypothetical protein
VDLYLHILEKIAVSKPTEIPVNRKGIYCSEAGETTFFDNSREIGRRKRLLGYLRRMR